jgi:hypothetical protein
MTTAWTVAASADQMSLTAQNEGEMTFTVTNPGPVTDTVAFDIRPGTGSQRSWYTVEKPQRTVDAQQAVVFTVAVKAPPGTPVQRYDFTAVAYSANTAPEESSRTSERVFFEPSPSKKPARKLPIPILIGALVLVLVVVGVLTFVLWPSGGKKPEAGGTPTPPSAPTSVRPTFPDIHGTYHGYVVQTLQDGKSVYESSDITLVLTQDQGRLTAVASSKSFPSGLVGSGTVTPAGAVTLRFEFLGPITYVGTQVSPGRLMGTYSALPTPGVTGTSSGTWDVCTCYSGA